MHAFLKDFFFYILIMPLPVKQHCLNASVSRNKHHLLQQTDTKCVTARQTDARTDIRQRGDHSVSTTGDSETMNFILSVLLLYKVHCLRLLNPEKNVKKII